MQQFPEIPDHPAIAHALRTGCPRTYKSIKCADCGQEFSGDHRIYISDGDAVCADCLKNRILEDYNIDDLAEAFDIERTTVYDHLMKMEDAC